MEATSRKQRRSLALLFILFMCATHTHAWEWEWVSGDWGHAIATCDDCGEEYDIEGCESSSDAESAAADLFCSGCGYCSRDVNANCWLEHHCERCGDCMDSGEYNDDIYDKLDLIICDNCIDDFREDLKQLKAACEICGQIFGLETDECDCEIDMLKAHCEDCGGEKCAECNTCLEVDGYEIEMGCEDHMLCNFNDCYEKAAGDGDHCALCGSCQNEICPDCLECENCWNHCSECDYCFTGQDIEWCKSDGGHCIHCCEDNDWICSGCGECTQGKGVDLCDDCGLCEDCCENKTNEADCSHGYCIESSDFSDHLCPGCGACPNDTECEYCGYCEECQSDYHCEHELCPEGDEYEEHLCNTCGDCCEIDEICEYCGRCPDCQEHCDHDLCPDGDEFDDGDHFICEQCGDCYDSDRCDDCELCADCCLANTESMGCDHELCVKGSEFVEHWCYEDDQCLEFCNHEEDCDHTDVESTWSSDDKAHWKVCRDCGRAVEKANHSDGDLETITEPDAAAKRNGTAQLNCAVCEQKMGIVSVPYTAIPENGAPYIITQPTNYTGKVSTVGWSYGPSLDNVNRYATFTVRAGGKDLNYQWYEKLGTESFKPITDKEVIFEGAQTASLKAYVRTDACIDDEYAKYYCVVTNASGSVTTNTVTFKAQHVFGHYEYEDENTHGYYCNGECNYMKKLSKHRFSEWELVRAATDKQTGLREQKCKDCGAKNSEVIPTVEPNHVHAYNLYKMTDKQHWCYCACGAQQTAEAQDHTFGSPVVNVQPTEEKAGRQTLTCTVCSYEKAERLDKLPHVHDWYTFNDAGMFYYDKNLKKQVTNTSMGSYSNKQHLVHCKGCDQVKTNSHCWANFVGIADATKQKTGKIVRYCGVCNFSESVYNDYGTWPIMVNGGKAYTYKFVKDGTTVRTIEKEVTQAKAGETIYLKYDLNSGEAYAEYWGFRTSDLKLKKWVDLKGWIGENDIPWGNDDKIIPELTFSIPKLNKDKPIPSDVNAYFTMPDGPAIVCADVEECNHPRTAMATGLPKAATCAGYGWEAGTVCTLCGKETPGTRIEPLGHDLPGRPIDGTRVVEYCSTWVSYWPNYKANNALFGYAGDYKCNRCGNIVKGGNLPLHHGIRDKDNIYDPKPGRTWDDWAEEDEDTNIKSPTCTKNGYTGDDICKYCKKIVFRGNAEDEWAAVGHEWGEWETVREATPKQKGLERRVCLHTPEWFVDIYGSSAVAHANGIEEHEETRLVDYQPDYSLKTAKTKLVFEWEYGKEPAAQVINFESAGRNKVTAIEALRQSVEGLATVTVSGLNVTVKPVASAVIAKYGTSANATLTITKVKTDNGSLQSEEVAQPIKLVMNVTKATPALSFASASKTVEIGKSEASPKVTKPTEDMMLKWRSADNNIATVNAETGVVTPIAEGSTTITASFAGNNFYTSASASYTLYTKKGQTGLAFPGSEFKIVEGSEFTAPKLDNPNHLTVTYTSSNPAVATVDATTGKVTVVGLGTTTITATFAGSKRVAGGSVSYKLVIGSLVGIDGVEAESSKEEIYDLAGRRLGKASRGVNIINSADSKTQKVLRK